MKTILKMLPVTFLMLTTHLTLAQTTTDDNAAVSAPAASPQAAPAKPKKKKKKPAPLNTATNDAASAAPAAPAPTPETAVVPEAAKKPPTQTVRDIGEKPKNSPDAGEATVAPTPVPQDAEAQNNRMKTLEGSTSPLSAQAQLGYSGSSIKHPFSQYAPNPTNDDIPPPVSLSGTVSARYRFNKITTVGLGTGVTTYTPFQGPTGTSVSDPYVDLARSYKIAGLHNRADVQFNLYTDNQLSSYGYRTGFTFMNESFHEFDFGLTVGFLFEVDVNTFGGGINQSHQKLYDFATDPYFEYKLSKNFNLRSVIGIQSVHRRTVAAGDNFFSLVHPSIYQSLGVGCQIVDAVFVYAFTEFTPFSNFNADNTIVGFSTIINLF